MVESPRLCHSPLSRDEDPSRSFSLVPGVDSQGYKAWCWWCKCKKKKDTDWHTRAVLFSSQAASSSFLVATSSFFMFGSCSFFKALLPFLAPSICSCKRWISPWATFGLLSSLEPRDERGILGWKGISFLLASAKPGLDTQHGDSLACS